MAPRSRRRVAVSRDGERCGAWASSDQRVRAGQARSTRRAHSARPARPAGEPSQDSVRRTVQRVDRCERRARRVEWAAGRAMRVPGAPVRPPGGRGETRRAGERPGGKSPANHDGRPIGRPVKISIGLRRVCVAGARIRGSAGSVETAGVAADLAVRGAARLVDDEVRGAPVGGAIEPGRCDRSASHPTHRACAMRHGIRGGAGKHVLTSSLRWPVGLGRCLVLLQRPEKYGAGAAFYVDPARRRLRVLSVDLRGRVSSGDA
jgi:hypothetical protein